MSVIFAMDATSSPPSWKSFVTVSRVLRARER